MGWVIRPGQDGSLYWMDDPAPFDGPRALFEAVEWQGYLEFERRRCYNDGYACGREDGRDGF